MIDYNDPIGQINAQCALEIFERQNPDLLTDPERIAKSNMLLEVACNYVPFEELSPSQMTAALEQTATATRDWFNLKPETARKAKQESATQQEERARTMTIAEMKKARGQQDAA